MLSRVFPSLYRDSHVHRLALFFRALRGTLMAMDPRRQDNPRIVLLTPGPENEHRSRDGLQPKRSAGSVVLGARPGIRSTGS